MASNRKIERLGISGDIIEKLHQLEIFNAKDLLELSPFLLKYHLDITLNEAKKILQISSEKLFPKSKTALELYHERSKLAPFQSTGCTKLNQFLHGGFQFGNITELVGLPGVGKSQICMSCCAAMLIQDHYHRLMNPDHHQSTIVYYDTELKFDSNRMITMIKYQYNDAFHHEINNEILEVFLNQIQIQRPKTSQELSQDIHHLDVNVLQQHIKLIIIDSMASLIRKEGMNEGEKDHYLTKHVSILKEVAELCHCCMLVTNQITPDTRSFYDLSHPTAQKTEFLSPSRHQIIENPSDIIHDKDGNYRPALGLTWYHCVTTRILLRNLMKTSDLNGVPDIPLDHSHSGAIDVIEDSLYCIGDTSTITDDRENVMIRNFMISKSPWLESNDINYMITMNGIVTID